MADTTGARAQIEFSEEVVAGGPDDFLEVRHIVMRGSNFEIGKKLAEIAHVRHEAGPIPYPFVDTTRAQRAYFEQHFPLLIERMKGVAAYFGMDISNDAVNFSGLFYGIALTGCSAVFYPPATACNGQGVLSRNFDYSTGTFWGKVPQDGQMAACARPYMIEMYPDEGYASLVTCLFDLLNGVMDGINSEGLAIAILSDSDVMSELGSQPFMGYRVGFNEMQIMRVVLDTCADVDEAKRVFRNATLYYNTAPYHYIVADRHGNSFVWENSPGMEQGHVIEGSGVPLVTTNFLLHRYPEDLPEEDNPLGWFNRYRAIKERIDVAAPPYDTGFIVETNKCVSFQTVPTDEEHPPVSTIWHALYYPEELRLEVDFYLGEKEGADSLGLAATRKSGYITFALKGQAAE
jgi:predicted choloylglycine hydrolase